MPIYEFVCGECGHEFEKILSFSATATPACANCGAVNVERQMGRPAIHFKGSGWYINDSKKASAKTGNNGPASSAASDNGEGGSGENVKPEKSEKAEGALSDKGTGGEGKTAEGKAAESSSKEKPASKETASSPTKAETA
ncbi:MAG: zinc ribbon domain-containing protein [Chloroflexi bacterium]|nr:MAG: zinc ribbon domain-containing protein [Chloroflexota bacterium]